MNFEIGKFYVQDASGSWDNDMSYVLVTEVRPTGKVRGAVASRLGKAKWDFIQYWYPLPTPISPDVIPTKILQKIKDKIDPKDYRVA